MTPARKLEFIIKDEFDNDIIHREVTFPRDLDALVIDREIALILLRLEEKRSMN